MSRIAKPYIGAVYFVRLSPCSANQYAQEWVHPTKNLSSHVENHAKPYTGAIFFAWFSPFSTNQYAQERVHPPGTSPLMLKTS